MYVERERERGGERERRKTEKRERIRRKNFY